MPLGVAVFLVASGMLFGFLFLPQNGIVEKKGGLDGVAAIVPSAQGAEVDNNAALNVQDASFFAATNRGNSESGQGMAGASYSGNKGMVQDVGVSLYVTPPSENRSEVINYIVQKGDSLPSIASYFGVSNDTIIAANPILQSHGIKSGEVIKILPTSGILYETQIGDTLASIAKIFNVSEDSLLQYNASISVSPVESGIIIVIPSDQAAHAALAVNSAI